MKRNIWLIILGLMVSTQVNAQFSFGIKGGLNFATITNYDELDIPQTVEDAFSSEGDNSYRTGYHVGVFLNYSAAKGFVSFQPELLYSNQGMKYSGSILGVDGTSVSSTIKTDYINIPLMVQINFIPKVLYIEAGPQVGFLINSKAEYEASAAGLSASDDWDISDDLNTVDFSLAFGLGFQVPKLPIGVHARYTIGLTDVHKQSEDGKTLNAVFLVGAFLKFGGGSD